jgi:glycosyltransferase 2 family protein
VIHERSIPLRHVVLGLALGVPVSGVFLYLASHNLAFQDVATSLRSAGPGRVALAVALIGVMYAFQALRWRRIARHEASLPFRNFYGYVVGGLACNNVVPGRVGDLLRAHWLSRAADIPRGRALATVVVDRASDLLALVALLAVTAPLAPRPAWLDRIELVAAASAIGLAALLLAARRHARRRDPACARSRLGTLASDGLATMAQTVNRRDAPIVAALSFAAWSAWSLSAWLVASSLGISLSPAEMLFVCAVVNLGVAVPSSPGFVGTYQWLCVATLGLFAVGHADAFAFSVLFQAVWFVPTTLAGLGLGVVYSGRRGLTLMRAPARPAEGPA